MNFFNINNKFVTKTNNNSSLKRKIQYEKKNITLDAYHKEHLKKYINNNVKSIDIHHKNNQFNFKYALLYKKQQNYKNNKSISQEELIKNEEIDYFLDIGNILYNYYNISPSQSIHDTNKKITKTNSFNFSLLLNNSEIPNNHIMNKLILNENINTKVSLYNDYLSKCDKNFINKEIKFKNVCCYCGSENIILNEQSISYCDDCSCINSINIETDKPSYKEPQKEISYLNYKRKNHLNEYLNQIQGKEITDIPIEIFNKIKYELRKLKILDANNNLINCSTIKYDILKDILKKIKLNRYYEHIAYIHYRITGVSSSCLPNELMDKIKNMFELIQNPFYKYCPDTRKSFLSYAYCIHKMLQLLGEQQYLQYFPLLKNRDKLYLHETIWANICRDLKWEFIPSM